MKIITVVEVKTEEEIKIGKGGRITVGEHIDMMLGRMIDYRNSNKPPYEENVKQIIINTEEFFKEVIITD